MKNTRIKYNFFHLFRIRYSEVDAQGIVFNSHYLTYFDCAITEYFRAIKFNYIKEVKKTQNDFHLIKSVLEFKKPLRFDQIVEAGVRISRIGNSSITFDIELYPIKKNIAHTKGEVIQVFVDQNLQKPVPLPKHFINKVNKFQS